MFTVCQFLHVFNQIYSELDTFPDFQISKFIHEKFLQLLDTILLFVVQTYLDIVYAHNSLAN